MHPNHKFMVGTAILLAIGVYFFTAGHNNAAVVIDDPFDGDWREHSATPRKTVWTP